MKYSILALVLVLVLVILILGGFWSIFVLFKRITPTKWIKFMRIFLIFAIVAIQINWFLKLNDAIKTSSQALEWYLTGASTTAIALAPSLYYVYKAIHKFFKNITSNNSQ